MSLITKIKCDGCGRKPNLLEWMRGELTNAGYPDWRHPGISFKAAGNPLNFTNKNKSRALWDALFGFPMPDELSFLCPQCQAHVESELPNLLSMEVPAPDRTVMELGERTQAVPQFYLGEPETH